MQKENNAPFIRSLDDENGVSTNQIMKYFTIGLLAVFLFSFYKNGIVPYLYSMNELGNSMGDSIQYLLKPISLLLLAIVTSVACEMIFFKVTKRIKGFKENFRYSIFKSYALIPAIVFVLIIPINTPSFVIVIGSIITTVIGKMLFGGFGHNVFNPAGVGRALISAAFLGMIVSEYGGYLNVKENDVLTGATALENIQSINWTGTYEQIVKPFGSLWDFFFGTIPGTIGETSALIILIIGALFVFKKVITYHIPAVFIGTIFIGSLIVGLFLGIPGEGIEMLWYPTFHVLSGGVMFGAVFMLTEPVTSPSSKRGQVIYAFFAAILTLIFRFTASAPEGVLTAIITMNMFTLIIEQKAVIIKAAKNTKKTLISSGLVAVAGILAISFIVYKVPNINDNIKELSEKPISLYEVKEDGKKKTYSINVVGYNEDGLEIDVTIENNKIILVEFVSNKETPGYGKDLIENEEYMKALIENVNNNKLYNIDRSASEYTTNDTNTGATFTANALTTALTSTLDWYLDKDLQPELTERPAPPVVADDIETLVEKVEIAAKLDEIGNGKLTEDRISKIDNDNFDYVISIANDKGIETYKAYNKITNTNFGDIEFTVIVRVIAPGGYGSDAQYSIVEIGQKEISNDGWAVEQTYINKYISLVLNDVETGNDLDSGTTLTKTAAVLKEFVIEALKDAGGVE